MNRRALLTGLAASTTLLLPPIIIPATPLGPPPWKYYFEDFPTALAKFDDLSDQGLRPWMTYTVHPGPKEHIVVGLQNEKS